MTSYVSQQGEDALLDIFFRFQKTGYFVDVGAFDGVHLSNSYVFERRGWSGLCVEAAPVYYELCVKNRPGSRCVNAACLARERGMVEFQFERSGLFSAVNADVDFVKDTFDKTHVPFHGFEKIKVPSATLNGLLGCSVERIDFASIDVEGAEVEVLVGFDLDRYRPRILLLEANTAAERKAIDDHLVPRGYSLARSMNWNHFYVRNEDDRRALRSITVSEKLERAPHPIDPLHSRFGGWGDARVHWPAEI